ncbi:hypothetical protein [Streptomyces sp. GZWMJZ-114]|uniref:hypothetical protein n=1 Tax=Streptomyces sp. GZWMJZ-114 TaxID=2494734 RepID=UPI001010432F|nr:hypothetical protein [Streptomyces sp. GZWMJZ-114]
MDLPHGIDIDYDALHALLAPGAGPPPADRTVASDLAAAALRAVAEGRWDLPAIRHPLGFLCLPVLRDGAKGVCVHLFDGEDVEEDAGGADIGDGTGGRDAGGGPGGRAPLVHAHSWSLVSLVLHGRVTNRSVRVVDDPVAPTHRVYEVRSGPDGTDEVRRTARLVRAEPGGSERSTSGDVYVVGPGEFHATVVGGGRPAATLVLGATLPGRSDMSLGPLRGEGHRSVREICDREETVVAVRAALRRIDGPGD